MRGQIKWLRNAALAVMLLGAVLSSASCGCGGGSAGPPRPDDGYYPPPEYWNHDWHPGDSWYGDGWYDDVWFDGGSRKNVQRELESPFEIELWLTGASYLQEAEHNLVQPAAGSSMEHFGLLNFTPRAPGGFPQGPLVLDCAYAIYRLSSRNFGAPALLRLDWESAPQPANCWLGVRRYAHGRWWWDWYAPDARNQALLRYLDDYRADDRAQSMYVTVLVSGSEPCVLSGIGLASWESDYNSESIPRNLR